MRKLLSDYPLQAGALTEDGSGFGARLAVTQPVSVDRVSVVGRTDVVASEGTRVMGRVLASRTTRPDFIWSPYPGFSSEFAQPDVGTAFQLTRLFSGGRANELRAGWSRIVIGWDRPHPEIPTIAADDGTRFPGSPAAYAYRNVSRNFELNDSAQWLAQLQPWRLVAARKDWARAVKRGRVVGARYGLAADLRPGWADYVRQSGAGPVYF